MKRTKHKSAVNGVPAIIIPKNPDAILCSDIHLREDQPTCRTDDYQAAQWNKLGFIRNLQRKYVCDVYNAGDLFHHWKPSPGLLSWTIANLPNQFHTIYGQHDLPQHNFDLRNKSGIHTLETDNTLTVLDECHFGQEPKEESIIRYSGTSYRRSILVWHKMVWQGKKLWPGQTDPSAKRLLRRYPQFNLILVGDNHQPFVEEYEGRLLVNPGSMMRMTADQIDHKPRVYLWYAETNTVEPVYLPIEQGVISREHIDRTEKRDGRIDAFISKLDNDYKAAVSFEENLERFAKTNKVRESVMEIVYKSIES